MSIARTTPAQKLRGAAIRTRLAMLTHRQSAGQRRETPAGRTRGARGPDRLAEEGPRDRLPVDRAVGVRSVSQRAQGPLRAVRDRAHDPAEATRRREGSALHVAGNRAGALSK